jgi:hypothetical protein
MPVFQTLRVYPAAGGCGSNLIAMRGFFNYDQILLTADASLVTCTLSFKVMKYNRLTREFSDVKNYADYEEAKAVTDFLGR